MRQPFSGAVLTGRTRWLAGLGAATAFALLVATQNYLILQGAGRTVSWLRLFLGELPVWYSWLLLLPAIRVLALRFPPLGPRLVLHLALHLLAALAAILLMIVLATGVRMLLGGFLPEAMGYLEGVRRGFLGSAVPFIPVYGILVLGILTWDYQRRIQERLVQESRLQAALTQARLDSLQGQLHPHFLFNTLHAISALMSEDVPAARKMMRRLSELLRISLEEGPHEVPLEEELRILDHYVEIQKIRFRDRLEIRSEMADDARGVLVPRMLLQPLVENAIKHGPDGRAVRGEILIRGEVDDSELRLTVEDNGPGFRATPRPVGTGIGIANTRARLEHIHGEAYRLELRDAEGGGALVEIRIPARSRGTRS